MIFAGCYHSNSLPSLGTSGLKISKVILGAMSYGSPEWQGWILDEEASLPLLEHAYKVGLNTWDTVNTASYPHNTEYYLYQKLIDIRIYRLIHIPMVAPKKSSGKPSVNIRSPARMSFS